MKWWTVFGALMLAGLAAVADAATPTAEAVASARAFIDSFNKGDMKAAAAQTSPDGMVIVDEIAPFIWSGPKAFETWGSALAADDKAAGNTDALVTDGKPIRVVVEAEHAYIVMPAVYTFKQKDAPMRETAQMVFTLQKGKTGWLITSFAWLGAKPKPAPAAAAK